MAYFDLNDKLRPDFPELIRRSGLSKQKVAEIFSVDVTTITRWCLRPDLVPHKHYQRLFDICHFINIVSFR